MQIIIANTFTRRKREFAMIDSYNDNKWDKFELSGRISDYLDYVGVPTKFFSNITLSEAPNTAGGAADDISAGDKSSR